jgi:hypothetical protein
MTTFCHLLPRLYPKHTPSFVLFLSTLASYFTLQIEMKLEKDSHHFAVSPTARFSICLSSKNEPHKKKSTFIKPNVQLGKLYQPHMLIQCFEHGF